MFKYKNAMISMAVVAMLAACGGGGGGGDDATNPPAGGGTGGTGGGDGGTAVVSDADLSNALALGAAGVLIPQGTGFVGQTYPAFNSNTDRGDGTSYGLFGYEAGTNAPIASFAISVDPIPDDVTATADDTKTGSVAFQMQDQASVANGQILKILVSQVSTTVTAAGAMTVDVADDATLTVYAKNEAGEVATVTVPATDALFSVTAVTPPEFSPEGDTEYRVVLDVDAAVAAAKAGAAGTDAGVLNDIAQFNSGAAVPFEVAFTMTNANIATGAEGEQGKDIAIDNRTVSGQGGINGYIQVGETATPETTE